VKPPTTSKPPSSSKPPTGSDPSGSSTPGSDGPSGDGGGLPGRDDSCSPDELTPTATASGDPLFPTLGNPGVDVLHYDVELTVGPNMSLSGEVGLDIDFTEDRDTFSLDSSGPQVSKVTVDGAAATFDEQPDELVITPPQPVHAGDHADVEVTYSLTVTTTTGADGLPIGWFTTAGGSYVLNEPDGARSWLPSNDHPSDKATYHFTLHVPTGLTGVANGELVSHNGDTWVWEEDRPMATYLIQVLTGDYEIVDGTGPHGLPLVSAVLRADRQRMQPLLDLTAQQIAFFEQYFGPYPLDRYGLAITDSFRGLAMETQERSQFSRDDLTGTGSSGDQLLLSHELGHQWFGDAVTLGRWQDIWLNESFATFAEWMWFDHAGLQPIEAAAQQALVMRQGRSTADPTVGDLFGFNSYEGGAVVLYALRRTIGDDDFFRVLQTWVTDYHGMSCTSGGFVALAEQISGKDLTEFFDDWLYAVKVPNSFP
jgi:aminopeptidase N